MPSFGVILLILYHTPENIYLLYFSLPDLLKYIYIDVRCDSGTVDT